MEIGTKQIISIKQKIFLHSLLRKEGKILFKKELFVKKELMFEKEFVENFYEYYHTNQMGEIVLIDSNYSKLSKYLISQFQKMEIVGLTKKEQKNDEILFIKK